MQTIRNIVEIVVKECSKDVPNVDAWYLEKTIARILALDSIKPYKNKTYGSIVKKKPFKIKGYRPMTKEELKIVQIVCDFNHSEFNMVLSSSRVRGVVEIRMILICFLYYYRSYTYSDLGNMFGRDHSTIIHNTGTHEDLLESDPLYVIKYFNTIVKLKEEMPHLFINKDVLENQSSEYAKIKADRKAKRIKNAIN
jgi:chromosomal replication initiation ATPase DnaA